MSGASNGAGEHARSRAALYIRVSTEEQRKSGYSLPDQSRVLREYARREGYEVVQEIADEGDSGANPFRPGMRRVLELAESGEIDTVLATKRNRFFRDLYYRRGIERDLRRHGVELKALDDTGNPIADGVLDLLGEEQRAQIARETRRGRMQRARSGEVVAGVPPCGFSSTPGRIRHLPEEEVARREREDERAARYRAMYEDLGLRVVAYPDGTLVASWRFGEAVLRKGSDTSRNKHATKHFHATEHPIVQSFQPGEDWMWCYVDEVVMEPS